LPSSASFVWKSVGFDAAAIAVSTEILLARSRSSRCWSNVCMLSVRPLAMWSLISWVFDGSLMHSWIERVERMISTAGTRPVCFLLGSRRRETTALRFSAMRARTCMCSSDGKKETSRLMVERTSLVWIDENTACPVSAAFIEVSTVWWSRISPTMITSGSWRSAAWSAWGKPSVSVPISRWVMMLLSWVNTNSIGSSIVMILAFRIRFTSSIMVARVVDLPMPVAPVTST
jgi:hypothetical protein